MSFRTHRERSRHRPRATAALACVVACLSTTAGAFASGPGGGGGVGAPPAPQLSGVRCAARCAGLRKAVEGSKILISGRHLSSVKKVLFTAHKGHVKAKPTNTSKSSVTAKVPKGAVSGKPKVVDSFKNSAKSPQALTIVDHLPPEGTFKLREAEATPHKAYFDGVHPPRLHFLFSASGPTDVRINVIRRHGGGELVRSYIEHKVQPNTDNALKWDGRNEKGKPAPNGHYRYTVGAISGAGADTTGKARFSFFGNEFPVRGHHSYGDGLGAGRGHQGQDVMANCHTPLVAARGGKVYWRKYQAGGAGNYLVINVSGGRSMMYAHLLRPSPLRKGDRVKTGEHIGVVGQTGDATACHLHFELWSKPGWYQGGNVLNPTPSLRLWDTWS